MKDTLMYATIFAYLVIAAALAYVVAPGAFHRAIWEIVTFMDEVDSMTRVLLI